MTRRRVLAVVLVVVLIGVLVVAWSSTRAPGEPAERAVASSPVPSPIAEPSPAVMPPGQFAENTQSYDALTLPTVDVFTIAPALAVDPRPADPVPPLVASPHEAGAPLFADPAAAPVGVLPAQLQFDGTTVPVIERQPYWARVMLSGRAGLPSQGVAGQLTAWVRTSDVDIVATSLSVQVSLGQHSIRILDGSSVVYETSEFAMGTSTTPTPTGRTFIMTTRVDPGAGFARGNPIVYLGLQSPTLDGFNGQNNAITAFHYHDAHSGAISNGCLRVGGDTIAQLAALPPGTPVVIAP